MSFFRRSKPWQPRDPKETPEGTVRTWPRLSRRALLRIGVYGGLAASGAIGWWRWRGSDAEVLRAGQTRRSSGDDFSPVRRDGRFQLDRPITEEAAAARYNNFYEFSSGKRVWAVIDPWEPDDWKLDVTGMVERPATFDLDDLARRFPYEERLYRHRCVETWAMAVPWTGFPLRLLLETVRPLAGAKYVKFTSFDHTQAAGARHNDRFSPWPYMEGLTMAEAANELAFIATGMYGHALLKQHGAPVRLVVPWKYGYKSAKSVVRIECVAGRPETFWNTIAPEEYGFESNVDPAVPHPRWSQAFEWDIGTRARRPTLPFNGYGEWVAALYANQQAAQTDLNRRTTGRLLHNRRAWCEDIIG